MQHFHDRLQRERLIAVLRGRLVSQPLLLEFFADLALDVEVEIRVRILGPPSREHRGGQQQNKAAGERAINAWVYFNLQASFIGNAENECDLQAMLAEEWGGRGWWLGLAKLARH